MGDRQITFRDVDPFSGASLGRTRTMPVPASPKGSLVGDSDDEEVPTGAIAEVLAWVDDPSLTDAVRSDRAKAALVAERSRGQSEQRKTLIASLTGRITG